MLILLTVTSLALQSVADTSPFRALTLPTPNRVRSASGAPGPDYWQQEASYTIQATLDTAAQTLRGSERIHYVNHSPDSLAFVWMQVEQNLFAANSITYTLNQPPLIFAGGVSFDFTGKGFIGGGVMEKFEVAGKPLMRTPYGTMMRSSWRRRLRPGPPSISTSPGISRSRRTAAGAWATSGHACTNSANGIRGSSSTTT